MGTLLYFLHLEGEVVMYLKRTTEEVVVEMSINDLEYSISTRRGIVWDNAFNEEIEFLTEYLGSEITTNLLMYTLGLSKQMNSNSYTEDFEIDVSRSAEDDSVLKITIVLEKREYDLLWVRYIWENVFDKGNK